MSKEETFSPIHRNNIILIQCQLSVYNLIEEPVATINNIQEEFNKEIPVILITNDLESESLLIKSSQEVSPLQKPFSTSKLQQLIQSILNKSL